MAFITAYDPRTRQTQIYTSTSTLHNALKTSQVVPLRANQTPFQTHYLEEYDGYVLDGAPINVWLGDGWGEGQREALAPLWESGQIPRPSDDLLEEDTHPLDEATVINLEEYKRSRTPGGFGISTGNLIIGAAVLGVLGVLASGKRRESSAGFGFE